MFKTFMGAEAGTGSGGFAAIQSPAFGHTGPGGWESSVIALLALTLAEIAVVAFLTKHLIG
ncbi:MAG: hypothetical protein ACYCO9_16430 [Streptosporangiaceae bacterium]